MLPSRGNLLVRPIDSAERFAGGAIIITAESRERLTVNQFEVIEVGTFAECDLLDGTDETEDCCRPHSFETVVDPTRYVVNGFEQYLRRVHPHPIRAGDWILVAPRSAIDGPDLLPEARFVHQDAVLGIFNMET